MWPVLTLQGRLGNVVFLCAQEEETVVRTYPDLPFPATTWEVIVTVQVIDGSSLGWEGDSRDVDK